MHVFSVRERESLDKAHRPRSSALSTAWLLGAQREGAELGVCEMSELDEVSPLVFQLDARPVLPACGLQLRCGPRVRHNTRELHGMLH